MKGWFFTYESKMWSHFSNVIKTEESQCLHHRRASNYENGSQCFICASMACRQSWVFPRERLFPYKLCEDMQLIFLGSGILCSPPPLYCVLSTPIGLMEKKTKVFLIPTEFHLPCYFYLHLSPWDVSSPANVTLPGASIFINIILRVTKVIEIFYHI